ncbi:nucleolar complex protein 4 homolog B [Drosophila persimilis]|uniref:nucleolar complex protein 4 homolog B n=1 Tax=Drosophila persimilis TaxID=7234 RepID=UPI000F08953C|nr:nucleolar complex protein 4 homolog B [Drosophila persimilis]
MKRRASFEGSSLTEQNTRRMRLQANAMLNASTFDPTPLAKFILNLRQKPANIDQNDLMAVLEVIFTNLLKRESLDTQALQWDSLYTETWVLLLDRIGSTSQVETLMALKVCMSLIKGEAESPLVEGDWPIGKLKSILEILINGPERTIVLKEFGKYTKYLDVLNLSIKFALELAPTGDYQHDTIKALNYLSLVNQLDLGKAVLSAQKYHVDTNKSHRSFTYEKARKKLNKIWRGIIASSNGIDEDLHRMVLVVLLERILPHMEDPIGVTDFLMNSLHEYDGPIALLALQGIFVLMQKQNITYPDVYEKLYQMFHARVFSNKYKSRLFYLADIFLTSTHLPENLVAAFVKRFARLALKSPPKDAVIMIRFICNLLLRHTGLQKLIRGDPLAEQISDPYNEKEKDPVKTEALNSSLWELHFLQKNAIPEVANAATFINNPLPIMEFDLGPLLDVEDSRIFDDLLKSKAKQYMLSYENTKTLALAKHDTVTKHFDLV